jgi:AraC family transcriptional regulator, regulatory protein of adaptative response / methylphosphotriester-DNA alkyltransferase methyltransferase
MGTEAINNKKPGSLRQREIVLQYLNKLDAHILELKNGMAERAMEIGEFADMLFIHPIHLSNTIKEVTGQSSCSLHEERLVKISKELLIETKASIKQIALQLTYDPSNFTKFFKHYVGMTPKEFRRTFDSNKLPKKLVA